MADHHHHHQHRPNRLSVPPTSRHTISTSISSATPTKSRPYPLYPYTATTPTPTPSKTPTLLLSFQILFKFLLLLPLPPFSLRSLYSLLPFLQSSPSSFNIFPFAFLVCLLSFLLSLSFSLFFSPSSSSKTPFHFRTNPNQPIFALSSISQSQHRLLFSKSLLLAVVFLLRFQALRYCGTAAMILAELSGSVAAARIVADRRRKNDNFGVGSHKLPGFLALFSGLLLLSISWDRIDCFPFSIGFIDKYGISVFPRENCFRIWPMLLPFVSGFLGFYERVSMNWGTIRALDQKRVRLISLFYTTIILFIPAAVSFIVFESGNGDGNVVSIASLGWPLANTVVFGVLLSENCSDDGKLVSSKDFQREFFVTFACTVVLELFYFPELSLWGLLLCGFLLYFGVKNLDPVHSHYPDFGLDAPPKIFGGFIMKPIRHILSERKSRKIALFLLINTGYMVVEFVAGFMSNSLGLISDACHMLFDCAALAIGLYASYISRLPANNQFNYGRGRFEVLSGYVNAVLLVLVGALIVLESFERILDPQEISTNSLLTVSIGGLVVNLVGLVFFHEEHHHAHGGAGSCAHAHSHSDSHCHHNSHDQEKHDEHAPVSHECHEKSLASHDDHHEHHLCDHQSIIDSSKIGSSSSHDLCGNAHDHEHSSHAHHQHEHRDHSPDHRCHDHHHHANPHELQHSDSKSDSSLGKSCSQQRAPVSGQKEPKKHHHHHIDHNMEGIFLHVLADTMGSVGVVISTLLIKYKGWLVADPACSIFISVLIVSSVISLLRNSAEILLQRIPRTHEQDLKEAINDSMKIKGLRSIQNLHFWSFTNTDIVGTLHLHVSDKIDTASVKAQVLHTFKDAGINDLTVQVECGK
uniref:Cation efflux protein transmembrane domain-containing protein n=1 Tax=Salix viminalis TaxID=40686 RepID=A0A6N2N3V8_SALVM